MRTKFKKKDNNVLGIDPGSTTIGYGVISTNCNELNPRAIGYGYIDLKNCRGPDKKLLQLYNDLREIFDRYKPSCIAIENVYFFKNAKTFVPVIQSKGVILLAAAKANIKVHEYTPLQIKQTIAGYGKADKSLVQKLIQSSLGIKSKINPDDTSDALAIALCHLRHSSYL